MAAESSPDFGVATSDTLLCIAEGRLEDALGALKTLKSIAAETRKAARLRRASRKPGSEGDPAAVEDEIVAAMTTKLTAAVMHARADVSVDDFDMLKSVWRVGAAVDAPGGDKWFCAHMLDQFDGAVAEIEQ